jgi:hypothetical protein
MMTNIEPPSLDGCEACDYSCTHLQACSRGFPSCRIQAVHDQGCTCRKGGCDHMFKMLDMVECKHGQVLETCSHACGRKPVWYMDLLVKRAYSKDLVMAVSLLLQLASGLGKKYPIFSTSGIFEAVKDLYDCWRADTEEGRDYVAIEDDLEMRRRVALADGEVTAA